MEWVIIIVLAVGLVIASVAAVGAILMMRHREQSRELVLHNTEALVQLSDALDEAVREIHRQGNQAQREIIEKYRALQDLQDMPAIRQHESTALLMADAAVNPPALLSLPNTTEPAEITQPVKRGRGRPRKTPAAVPAPADLNPIEPTTDEPAFIKPEPTKPEPAKPKSTKTKPADYATLLPAPKPIPRKNANNAKRQKVLALHAQGLATADIAKKLSIGQREVVLILETAERRGE